MEGIGARMHGLRLAAICHSFVEGRVRRSIFGLPGSLHPDPDVRISRHSPAIQLGQRRPDFKVVIRIEHCDHCCSLYSKVRLITYKEKLPHSQSALVLGISSIITACCCWGVIGVILGAIGIYESNKAIAIYNEHPNDFDGINNAQTGRTTSIIGIIIGVISMLWMIYMFSSGDYEMFYEHYEQFLEDNA